MSVCAFILFMLPCVQVAALRRAGYSSNETYSLSKRDYEAEYEARAQQKALASLMNEIHEGRPLTRLKLK
jgi:hypothetical protein